MINEPARIIEFPVSRRLAAMNEIERKCCSFRLRCMDADTNEKIKPRTWFDDALEAVKSYNPFPTDDLPPSAA